MSAKLVRIVRRNCSQFSADQNYYLLSGRYLHYLIAIMQQVVRYFFETRIETGQRSVYPLTAGLVVENFNSRITIVVELGAMKNISGTKFPSGMRSNSAIRHNLDKYDTQNLEI